jgi:threonine/homoserine/homoserine lactone efflux protein
VTLAFLLALAFLFGSWKAGSGIGQKVLFAVGGIYFVWLLWSGWVEWRERRNDDPGR